MSMPLVKVFTTQQQSSIAIWNIEESFQELEEIAIKYHIDLRKSFYKNEDHYKEYLASRIALKKINPEFVVEENIEKIAPKLKSLKTNISISHCKKMCAVIANDICSVGIDVEHVTPRILNISKRFMNTHELNFIPKNDQLLMNYIVWSCKEAVFKKYHSLHLDFRENMRVESFEIKSLQHIFCEISDENLHIREKIFIEMFDDVVLAHTK
jgi:phosphopantetheinyl transferase (holo-ACP synthase)